VKLIIMLNKRTITLLSLIILLFTACSHAKFDRDNWNDGDGLTFAYRNKMVEDLLQNYKLKGLRYQQVIHLLHRPQQSNPTQMIYEIDEVNKPGQPHYVKQLILAMKDSVVVDAKIYEHTDKKK
jgi:hypothetical protein